MAGWAALGDPAVAEAGWGLGLCVVWSLLCRRGSEGLLSLLLCSACYTSPRISDIFIY